MQEKIVPIIDGIQSLEHSFKTKVDQLKQDEERINRDISEIPTKGTASCLEVLRSNFFRLGEKAAWIKELRKDYENLEVFCQEKVEQLQKEQNKLKGEIDLKQAEALKGKDSLSLFPRNKTLSPEFRQAKGNTEDKLKQSVSSLEKLSNEAEKMLFIAEQKGMIADQQERLDNIKMNKYKLIEFYKNAKDKKERYVYAYFKGPQNPEEDYKRLEWAASRSLRSLHLSIEEIENKRIDSVSAQSKQSVMLRPDTTTEDKMKNFREKQDELSSKMQRLEDLEKKMKGLEDYMGRVDRVLDMHKHIEDLFFKNLPGDYRDQYQKEFDEWRERVLNPDEKRPNGVEKEYAQYIKDFFQKIVAAPDKSKRLSDLDKRAKDLIGRLSDRDRREYQSKFDELSREASSDSLPPVSLIAEGNYRKLIEELEKSISLKESETISSLARRLRSFTGI